ncbi:DM13 domain-containing protein [Sulfitobacter sp. JB4-11]|uniref:DM13 domain-containing protein n=1 Tax=Sulfitobacter rhodophyticola TaxID=3238304 RepID=UPI0035171001
MRNIITAAITAFLIVGPVTAAFANTSGTFTGASNHVTTGGVTITKNADGTATVTFDSSFSLDGAPDPRVGFGKDGTFINASDLGVLKKLDGAQSYVVPASLSIDDYNELYIWCLKFAVPLGVAQLN